MSKILITERELRNTLFKTFLKNPALLKEEPQEKTVATTDTQDAQDTAIKDDAAKIMSAVLKRGTSIGEDREVRRELILKTLQYDYVKSNSGIFSFNPLSLNPGHSLLDHALLKDLPDNAALTWSKAATTDEWQRQDLVDALQISSSLIPTDAVGKVSGKVLRKIDVFTTLLTLANNIKFSIYLANRDEPDHQGVIEPVITSTDPDQTYSNMQHLTKGELGNAWAWYLGYAVCDFISLIPYLGFFFESHVMRNVVDSKLGVTWNENLNKNLVGYELDKNTGNFIETVNVKSESHMPADMAPTKSTGTDLIPNHSVEQARKMIDEVTMEVSESFANINKVKPGDEFDQLIDELDDIVNVNKNVTKEVTRAENITHDAFLKLSSEDKALYKGSSITDTQGNPTSYNLKTNDAADAAKKTEISSNTSSAGQLEITNTQRTISKDKEKLKKRIQKIKNKQKNKKTRITDDEFQKLPDNIKSQYIYTGKTNDKGLKIYQVKDSILTTTSSFDRVVSFEIKQSLELPENANIITGDHIKNFLENLTLTTGVDQKVFFEELTATLKNAFPEANIVINNQEEFLNYYKIMLENKKSSFGKAFSKKIEDFKGIAIGKAKPRNISNVSEIFPEKLKQLYTQKLTDLDSAIKNTINNDVLYGKIIDDLKNDPFFLQGKSNKEIEQYLMSFKNSEGKSIPSDGVAINNLVDFFKARQNNIKEVFELERDMLFFLNKENTTLTNLDFLGARPDRSITSILNEKYISNAKLTENFSKFSEPFSLLKKNNLINEFLYRKQVARFHKGINKNLNSKLDVILGLIDPNATNSIILKNDELAEKFKKFKIGEVIDGVLQINNSETIENVYQYFNYLNRLLGRYEAAFTFINEPDAMKKSEYIFDLIDKKVFEYSPEATIPIEDMLKYEKMSASNPKQLEKNMGPKKAPKVLTTQDEIDEAIRNKTINPTFLQNKTTLSFLDPQEINVKIPEIISHQQLENAETAAKSFNINTKSGGRFRNLMDEIRELDKKLEDIIDINVEIQRNLDKQITEIQQSIKLGRAGENEKAELIMLQMQKQFLTDFNEGLAKKINKIREESSLGTEGLNVLTTHKVTADTPYAEIASGASTSGQKVDLPAPMFHGWEEMGEYGRESFQKVGALTLFLDWCQNFRTDFEARWVKKILKQLPWARKTDLDLNAKTLWSRFSDWLKKWTGDLSSMMAGKAKSDVNVSLGQLIKGIFVPGSVSELAVDLGFLSGVTSALKTYKLYAVIHQGFCFAALAGAIGAFIKAYLLGTCLKLVYRLLLHGDVKLAKLGRGVLTGLTKRTADIGRVLMRIAKAHEKNFLLETATALAEEEPEAYMKTLQQKSNFEHESQNWDSRGVFAWGIDGLTGNWTEDFTPLGVNLNLVKRNFDSKDPESLYGLLDEMYKLYNSLPESLDDWKINLETEFQKIYNNPQGLVDKDKKAASVLDFVETSFINLLDETDILLTQADQLNKFKADSKEYVKISQKFKKKNQFIRAVIYAHCMNLAAGKTDTDFTKHPYYFNKQLSQKLQNLNILRTFLMDQIDVIADVVKMSGHKDFNIDSLITGGYHNISVNAANISFRYAPRYGYSYLEGDAAKNNPIPHFQRTTTMPNGSEMRNIALELYTYHRLSSTPGAGVKPNNLLHHTLKVIYDSIDLINIWNTASSNVLNQVPLNNGINEILNNK